MATRLADEIRKILKESYTRAKAKGFQLDTGPWDESTVRALERLLKGERDD